MTNEDLHSLFIYESHGMLRRIGGRKPYPWRSIGRQGRYLATTVAGVTYYLHRLVWQYHTGNVPVMVDHVNGNPADNRIENLRECTNAQNQYNSPKKVSNRAGHKGVVFHPKCTLKPWQAKIAAGGKVHSLGYYPTREEAAAAYAAGARRIAGEFARAA